MKRRLRALTKVMIKAKVLDIDISKERISLGIKQLTEDPFAGQADAYRKGEVVTRTVASVSDNGIDVTVGENMTGFIGGLTSVEIGQNNALTALPLVKKSMLL